MTLKKNNHNIPQWVNMECFFGVTINRLPLICVSVQYLARNTVYLLLYQSSWMIGKGLNQTYQPMRSYNFTP